MESSSTPEAKRAPMEETLTSTAQAWDSRLLERALPGLTRWPKRCLSGGLCWKLSPGRSWASEPLRSHLRGCPGGHSQGGHSRGSTPPSTVKPPEEVLRELLAPCWLQEPGVLRKLHRTGGSWQRHRWTFQCPLLTTLNRAPAGKGEIFAEHISVITEQAKKGGFAVERHLNR